MRMGLRRHFHQFPVRGEDGDDGASPPEYRQIHRRGQEKVNAQSHAEKMPEPLLISGAAATAEQPAVSPVKHR